MQVQHAIKPRPSGTPLISDGGCEKGSSVQQTLLDDASFHLKMEEFKHYNFAKTFELKPWDNDPSLEQHSSRSTPDTEKIDIQNSGGNSW